VVIVAVSLLALLLLVIFLIGMLVVIIDLLLVIGGIGKVVLFALLLIAQHFIGLLDLHKFLRIGRILGDVRVVFLGKLIVSALDLLLRSRPVESQGLVMAEH